MDTWLATVVVATEEWIIKMGQPAVSCVLNRLGDVVRTNTESTATSGTDI